MSLKEGAERFTVVSAFLALEYYQSGFLPIINVFTNLQLHFYFLCDNGFVYKHENLQNKIQRSL
jgi:hypothetical protein